MDTARFDALARFVARRSSRRALGAAVLATGGMLSPVALRSARAACDEGLTDCGGQCVDLSLNVYHCGACGRACVGEGGSSECVDGECAKAEPTCDEGLTDCFGECVDLSSDTYHCGTCARACAGEGAIGECVDGECLGAEPTPMDEVPTEPAAEPTEEEPDEDVTAEPTPEADASTADLDLFTLALSIERAELALFEAALARFDAAGLTKAGLPKSTTKRLTAIRDHEQAHVDALAAAIGDLGGTTATEMTFDFVLTDVPGFLTLASTLETAAVAAYAGIAPEVANRALLGTLLGIHSVEARHAAYLDDLRGVTPFPDAIDKPGDRQATTDLIARYVKQ